MSLIVNCNIYATFVLHAHKLSQMQIIVVIQYQNNLFKDNLINMINTVLQEH